MDLLSLVLARMRLSSSLLARFDAAGAWSVDVPDGDAITAYYALTGDCWIISASDAPVHLRAGDLLMLPPWCAHRLCSSPEVASIPIGDVARQAGKELWNSEQPLGAVMILDHRDEPVVPPETQLLAMMFRAEGSYQDQLVNCLPPLFHLSAAEIGFVEIMTMIRHFVFDQMEARPYGYAASAHRMAELLLIELLRSVVVRQPRGTTGWLNGLASQPIASAMTALHLDPQRRWSLGELAREAQLSRSKFSAEFSRIVGQSPMNYVQGVRLQWAAEALARGAALKALSDSLGYATPYGFHKAFVRQFGRPPGEWRKQNQLPTGRGE
jgi:AraC-like DNA-binding protein